MALIRRSEPPANKHLIRVQDSSPNTEKGMLGTVQRERGDVYDTNDTEHTESNQTHTHYTNQHKQTRSLDTH